VYTIRIIHADGNWTRVRLHTISLDEARAEWQNYVWNYLDDRGDLRVELKQDRKIIAFETRG
jgi:hypothetical protein